MVDSRFHKNSGEQSLGHLAALVGADCDPAHTDFIITGVSSLQDAGATEISFFDNVKYKAALQQTNAGACVVSKDVAHLAPEGCRLLISDNPYKGYALIAQKFYPVDWMPEPSVSKAAHIDKTAVIGNKCVIEAGAVIESGVEIGDSVWVESGAVIRQNVVIGAHTRIGAGASVSHAKIGMHTRLYPGVRIGQDGFGFAIDPAGHVKVPQLGRVIIGDHVEIGANSCIDRGAGPDTVIGDGTWIDNLVQIGHNVRVGKGCVIVAQAGVAGSTELADYAVIAAQAGVAGHLKIGAGARIAAQAGIMRNVEAGAEVMGAPAMPAKQYLRQVAMLKKMTEK